MSKTNIINSNDSKGSIGIFILYNSVNMHLYIYLLHLLIVSKKHAMFLSVPSKRSCFFLFDLGNFYDTVYIHHGVLEYPEVQLFFTVKLATGEKLNL